LVIILFALPALLLLLAIFSMLFRLFFFVRVFTVFSFILLFFFGLSCITTSVSFSFSNHICDSAESLIRLDSTLPSACVDNSNTFEYLNLCLLHNTTSQNFLEDNQIGDLYYQIKITLEDDTSNLENTLFYSQCPYTINNWEQIYSLSWNTSTDIAQSSATIQMLISSLGFISTSCPQYQTSCSQLSQELSSFGALLQIINCAPLSSYYFTTVEQTLCQDLNDSLLWVAVCNAAVILLMIPILMISFRFGFRPWSNQTEPRQQLLSTIQPISYQAVPTSSQESFKNEPFHYQATAPTMEEDVEGDYPSINPNYQETV